MSLNAVTWTQGDWALFLDVDGTLLEIAETPQSVRVPDKLKMLLSRASAHLDGAVALVSGRSLAEIDHLFAPLRACASGVHGCERRDARGSVVHATLDSRLLDAARADLNNFVSSHQGLLLEDKGYSLAVHFRRAPDLSPDVFERMSQVRTRLGTAFVLQAGKCVFELRPGAWSKGTAIAQFMREPPFRGRTPVFAGDDLADEQGFAVVNALGGVSIRVGSAAMTIARHRLRDVSAVVQWLERIPPAVEQQ
jgi:trehalose 6-phosphate phosphatase